MRPFARPGIAGDRQGGVVEAETTIIKIWGDGVIEPPELLRAVQWEVVPGTTYEKAVLLDVDTVTPEYRAFEKQLYTQTLRDLGFQGLLPQEQERRIGKQKEKRKEGAER